MSEFQEYVATPKIMASISKIAQIKVMDLVNSEYHGNKYELPILLYSFNHLSDIHLSLTIGNSLQLQRLWRAYQTLLRSI